MAVGASVVAPAVAAVPPAVGNPVLASLSSLKSTVCELYQRRFCLSLNWYSTEHLSYTTWEFQSLLASLEFHNE